VAPRLRPVRRSSTVQPRAHTFDRIHEEIAYRLLPTLQVVGPDDGADARDSICERDEPEPAVLEPVDGYVPGAFFFGVTVGVAEVPEECGACVLLLRTLGFEPVAQKGIATGGVLLHNARATTGWCRHRSRPPHAYPRAAFRRCAPDSLRRPEFPAGQSDGSGFRRIPSGAPGRKTAATCSSLRQS